MQCNKNFLEFFIYLLVQFFKMTPYISTGILWPINSKLFLIKNKSEENET